jgi:hypothetical protein
MVRSLSVSSNGSQRSNQNHQNRGSTIKKKNSGLLFDYSQQAPYEGVKPSEGIYTLDYRR